MEQRANDWTQDYLQYLNIEDWVLNNSNVERTKGVFVLNVAEKTGEIRAELSENYIVWTLLKAIFTSPHPWGVLFQELYWMTTTFYVEL